MSYDQAMRWAKQHRKGTHQHVIMSTDSGFWPSGEWLRECWWPYVDRCRKQGIEPMNQEEYYKQSLR